MLRNCPQVWTAAPEPGRLTSATHSSDVQLGFRKEKVSTVMAKKSWAEMSGLQKAVIITLGTAEVVATTYAAVDLLRRPREQVRGPKLLWAAGLFVQPVGPVAYLSVGRIG